MAEHRVDVPFLDAGLASEPDSHYSGLLIQRDAAESGAILERSHTAGRPLALLLHGMGSHKNAVFFKPLAHALPIDSYRFDHRGEGESPGEWTNGQYDTYAAEVAHVVEYLVTRFGYVIELIVAHSKSVAITYAYASKFCTKPGLHRPPALMAMFSGRFWMSRVYERADEFEPSFQQKGHFERQIPTRNGMRAVQMTREDFIAGCEYPTPQHAARLPTSVQVLIVHGTDDKVVPVVDSAGYMNALTAQPTRRPGTVQLQMIEGCDHNYSGAYRANMVERVLKWRATCLAAQQHAPAAPPSWTAGTRGSRGALIVVEGLDRAGKSTQVARLVDLLHARLVKFPDRTTEIGQMINAYLTNARDTPDEAIHLLFSANRWEVMQSIVQTLSSGQSVVCDRYAFSGIAYSRAKGLDLGWCLAPDVGIPMPDLTLFLDLDEATAAARSAYGEERYEKLAFQRVVRQTFADVEHLVQAGGGVWTRVNAAGTPDEVYDVVRAEAQRVLQRVQHDHASLRPLALDMLPPAEPQSQQRPSL
ncbi:dTMP kinase [Malassezia japonica]|uniref:Thymidylate kinase n=1 Tax=Malassezia japonica TaxID=223818 RepID=A0AAF0J8U3_9BASI|nr:dTMP kinase [Malassezia japonica]WFD37633.1 dTMP kinase [Malassezia japonica]